jgi:hypothetical protein
VPLASSGKAACIKVGATNWANANSSEDALWWCCRQKRLKMDFRQHNITLWQACVLLIAWFNSIIFKQKKYSPEVYQDASVIMPMPNENSSPEFKNNSPWSFGLTELHEKSTENRLRGGINHTTMDL